MLDLEMGEFALRLAELAQEHQEVEALLSVVHDGLQVEGQGDDLQVVADRAGLERLRAAQVAWVMFYAMRQRAPVEEAAASVLVKLAHQHPAVKALLQAFTGMDSGIRGAIRDYADVEEAAENIRALRDAMTAAERLEEAPKTGSDSGSGG